SERPAAPGRSLSSDRSNKVKGARGWAGQRPNRHSGEQDLKADHVFQPAEE
ncbi:MAG: hypothetical protein JWP23_880, partial [Phenylobacterium sp.]|nr:hypothetical protein [Phenylobacterium sp.]